ncbi:MAG: IS630 family transposase [Gammaproteobacteria bacterium]|nr:IS630 family transposase [Gammaproteobacteria bacterium]
MSETRTSAPVRRQALVALADARIGINTIAKLVRYSVSSVRRWIRRAKGTGDLQDQPRSGRPAIYPQELQIRIVAFYCQTRPLPGAGRWTLRWAERRLRSDSTVVGASPSKSTVHRLLRRNRLRPHQSRYFLHITDPDFFPKMEHLDDRYRNPPANLFFFDECPGIQILKRLTPDLQTEAMRKRLEEFEYIRHGTLDVLAFLQHADGKVHIECQADHKTDTFLAAFRRHANRFAQAEPLHYVMDNLSSHRGYRFCQLVAELSAIACPPEQQLSTLDQRVEWLARQDKRIIIHYTPYHGSWLNWIEFWFGIMGRKVLGESFGSPDELKAALEAFVVDWNTLLAHPFKWSYDGSGLHEKAVTRFTKMLHLSAPQMELRILTKQMGLLTNLLHDYVSEVPQATWERFSEVLRLQSDAITGLIQDEPGPVRKNNARQAFAKLNEALREYFAPPTKWLSENLKLPQ